MNQSFMHYIISCFKFFFIAIEKKEDKMKLIFLIFFVLTIKFIITHLHQSGLRTLFV